MSRFAIDVAAWCEKAQVRGDQALRAISLELLSRIVLRSPVGNPELWASNASARYKRDTFNLFAERINQRATIFNANLVAAGEVTRSGRVRGAQKLVKLKSGRALQRAFPNVAGKGYTGGRFRANWYTSLAAPSSASSKKVDASGQTSIAAGTTVIAGARLGTVIFMMNNLPYAERLEFGWSKQAPGGMIRLVVAEFQGIVADAVRAPPPT